ncbi:RNA polymerase factor sigma-70 [Pseudomonas putida]
MMEQRLTTTCEMSLLQAFIDHRTLLVNIAARITGCHSRAEDVVQDAFFRLQAAPAITSSLKEQMGYLLRVVRNLAIDHYRKQAVEQRYCSHEDEDLQQVVDGATPQDTHLNRVTLDLVEHALGELPSRTRYAFEMYRLHGVPQRTLALELGVSPTLVNFMVRDALVHCRRASGDLLVA